MTAITPPDELISQIRDALAHLYDHAHLQNHPLTTWLALDLSNERASRAQRLCKLLLDGIEELRPQGIVPADASRAYVILTYRYLDGLSMEAIGARLSLSQRQIYREHEKGVRAVAHLLWDQIRPANAVAAPIENHLDIVRTEVERLRSNVHIEPIHLQEILPAAAAMLLPLSQQSGIQIHLPDLQGLPPIAADRTMLRQALLIFMTHALRTLQGELRLQVQSASESLRLSMAGQIATAAPPRATPAGEKPELGLSIAQSLIEAQGGSVQLHAQAQSWSIHLSLPLAGRATLLVIDDNTDIVTLIQRYLSVYAISVTGVADPDQAVQQIPTLQPGAILLDVMMPRRDGWEVLQTIKTMPEANTIPVIICSVLNEPQLAFSMGASGYLTKPFSQEQLLVALQHSLGSLLPPQG